MNLEAFPENTQWCVVADVTWQPRIKRRPEKLGRWLLKGTCAERIWSSSSSTKIEKRLLQ